jgi:hypothetical protein
MKNNFKFRLTNLFPKLFFSNKPNQFLSEKFNLMFSLKTKKKNLPFYV